MSVDFAIEAVGFVLSSFVYFSMFLKIRCSFCINVFLPFSPPIDDLLSNIFKYEISEVLRKTSFRSNQGTHRQTVPLTWVDALVRGITYFFCPK